MTELLEELRNRVQQNQGAKSDIHALNVKGHHIRRCGDCGEAYSHKHETRFCPTCGCEIFKGHHH